MFQASIIARGHQIFTSARPRIASRVKKVSRPTCEAASRTRLPIDAVDLERAGGHR